MWIILEIHFYNESSRLKTESRSAVSDSLRPHGLYSPWNSPGQNTGVGGFSLLQGIFPTQGSNPGLPHCRQILYQLIHQGSPKRLEWIANPFSSGSSQPRNRTGVSCIAGVIFISWKNPRRRKWQPTPVFWPGEFHGLHSPWGRKRVGCDWATSTSLLDQLSR